MAKDPICGMEVDPEKAKFKLDRNGTTYYFCSKQCYEEFKGKTDEATPSKEKTEEESAKCVINIEDMTCGSCAAKIEKNIKSKNGVKDANVNLATGKATVNYDPQKITEELLEKVVVDTGYKVKKPETTSTLKLKVMGMDNPHCMGIVGSALDKLPGIKSKELLPTEKASIEYDPEIIDSGKIRQIIKDAGYENFLDTEAKDKEKEAREKEIRSLKYKTSTAMILGLPLLYFAMGPHVGLPIPGAIIQNMGIIQFIITLPIIFVGYEFYTKGIKSVIKAKTANMDTLVAIGTGSAFLYSIWAMIRGIHGELYFEVAGLLIAFILL